MINTLHKINIYIHAHTVFTTFVAAVVINIVGECEQRFYCLYLQLVLLNSKIYKIPALSSLSADLYDSCSYSPMPMEEKPSLLPQNMPFEAIDYFKQVLFLFFKKGKTEEEPFTPTLPVYRNPNS